jgi:hypothetical protein
MTSDSAESAGFSPDTLSGTIESLRLHTSSWLAKMQSRVRIETLRPLPEFLGIDPAAGFCLSPGAFTPPVRKVDKGSPEKVQSRMKLNLAFFLTNYVVIAAMTAVIVALMHPGMIFFVGLVYGLWMLHAYMIRHEVVLGGVRLHSLVSVQHRFYGLLVLTVLVIIWKCLIPTLIFVAISGLLILVHAFMRDPKQIEMLDRSRAESEDEYDAMEGGTNESNSYSRESEGLINRSQGRSDAD